MRAAGGGETAVPTLPTSRSPSSTASPGGAARVEAQAAQVPVRLALVVEARDGLLADVAALGEADGALVDPRLLAASSRCRISAPRRGPAGLDPEDLGGLG